MKTLFVVQSDGTRRLEWRDTPAPSPTPEQAVVRVLAVALAWSDALQVRGEYAGPVPDPPFVPGHEFCGLVAQPPTGPQRSALVAGARVCGFLPGPGALAEYIAVDPAWLRPAPAHLSDAETAALTTPFLTADAAVLTVGRMQPGDVVAIHAAAGGVGRVAVQLARRYGAGTILATAGSPQRRLIAERLGADATSDYADFPQLVRDWAPGGADLILDSVGGQVFDDSLHALRPLGRLVTIGASSGQAPKGPKLPTLWQRSAQVSGLHIARWLSDEPRLLDGSYRRFDAITSRGDLRVPVASIHDAANVAEALAAVGDRATDGRVVVSLAVD
ncbi:NAD(P)H-quinone oxidoreductase [Nocardioides endophyticus]|uniref:NAD(P)H-quinone oxidoreductase n=1 Tax=Nocardioides endophyticus TaxID=1353775 RepID=A0ABP8YHJ3_9ACTN